MEFEQNSSAISRSFNNTGCGPRLIAKSEKISEYFFHENTYGSNYGSYSIHLPKEEVDIESWLMEIAENSGGHKNWEEILNNISVPKNKMMVFDVKEAIPDVQRSPVEILKAALVLSMSNQFCYLPEGPRIFTRQRMSRKIKLVEINIDEYYELD